MDGIKANVIFKIRGMNDAKGLVYWELFNGTPVEIKREDGKYILYLGQYISRELKEEDLHLMAEGRFWSVVKKYLLMYEDFLKGELKRLARRVRARERRRNGEW